MWRRSWNLISGKPALLRSGLKEAVARLRKSLNGFVFSALLTEGSAELYELGEGVVSVLWS